MGWQVTISFGDFTLSHADEDDTIDSMKSGAYTTAFRCCVAQVSGLIESGLLDEDGPDMDEAAAALVAAAEEEDEEE